MIGPMDINLPYLKEDIDRHGNARLYVRLKGRKIRIRALPGTADFLEAYQAALKELGAAVSADPQKGGALTKGTLEWLGETYMRDSAKFRKLDPKSKETRKSILRSCFAEPLKPGANATIGQCPLSALKTKHIRILRDRKVDVPGAANNRLKYLSAMFTWAAEEGLFERNIVRDVQRLEYSSDGFYTWTVEEVRQFETRWPLGTKPRLAMSLLLYTGARGCDMVKFGRQHIKNGVLTFRPNKTRKSTGKILELPVLSELQQVIDAGPTGELNYLITEYKKPFSAAGFRNWFRERCDEAQLPQCTGHGLRKAGATIAAENGATEAQLMAIYGWETAKEAARYIKKARQKKLAAGAMGLIRPVDEDKD
jgi:integrase